MAKPLVLRLWVGPTTRTECPRSAASIRRRAVPSVDPPGAGPGDHEVPDVPSGRPTAGSRHRPGRLAQRTAPPSPVQHPTDRPRPRPGPGRVPEALRPHRGAAGSTTVHPTRASRRHAHLDEPVHARPSMRASVSTMDSSCGDSRCWTRNDRAPTFHSATPRRRWGTNSASVDESPSRGRPVRPRPVAARRRPGSRSPTAAPAPIRPARIPPRPSCRDPTTGGARRHWTLPGPETISMTTGATAPLPSWRGSPTPRPRRPRPRRFDRCGPGPSRRRLRRCRVRLATTPWHRS